MAPKFLSTVLLLLVFINVKAFEEGDNKGLIKGKVLEIKTDIPIEYATVAIYNAADSAVVSGTISDAKGDFQIGNLDDGRYYIVVSFLGYQEKNISTLDISAGNRIVDVGTVKLAPSVKSLKEVEIVGTQKALDYKIDRKVINVSQMQTSASMSAVEVLQNIPSVKVDIEGNVSLRGSSGFTVLIDGKPTILDPGDALQQIPASSIDNIEIITNPSVKYRPDGTSGIINIITKKNKTNGMNGQVSVNTGMFERNGGDVLLNYRAKQVNYLFGADYNVRKNPGTVNTERRSTIGDTVYSILSDGTSERYRKNWSLRGGLEFDVTPKDNFSISGRYGYRYWAGNNILDYHSFSDPAALNQLYTSYEERYRGGNFYSFNTNYQHKFNEKGHILNFQLDMGSGDGDERTTNELLDENHRRTTGKISYETGPGKHTEIRLDYTLPFSDDNKLEAGFQGRYNYSEDNTALDSFYRETDAYQPLNKYVNSTKYNQDISGMYGIYSGKINNFGFQLGLRGEYLHQLTRTTVVNQQYALHQFDYFPTIHVSLDLSGSNQFITSYTRRINRPRSYMFEPFITWLDAYTIRRGNPGLIPEYIDSYELGYLKKFDNSSFSIESYYRVTHNKIENIRSVYDENIVLQSPENVGKDYSFGTEANLNLTNIRWWEINLMADLFRYQVKGNFNNQLFANQSFNWGLRFNNTVYLPLKSQFQCNLSYNSPTVTAQGRDEGYFVLDAAYRIDLFKRSLSAVVQVSDLLSTATRENTTYGTDFYYHSRYSNQAPYVTFTLSYRINKYLPEKPEQPQQDDAGGSDF